MIPNFELHFSQAFLQTYYMHDTNTSSRKSTGQVRLIITNCSPLPMPNQPAENRERRWGIGLNSFAPDLSTWCRPTDTASLTIKRIATLTVLSTQNRELWSWEKFCLCRISPTSPYFFQFVFFISLKLCNI
jgi:hypothetical protein